MEHSVILTKELLTINRIAGVTMKRVSGVLLHPTMFYNEKDAIGTLGKNAFEIIDWVSSAGLKYLQILPLNPTGFGDSPYSSFSAFAGNPYLIDLESVAEEGELDRRDIESYSEKIKSHGKVDYAHVSKNKVKLLRKAFERARKEPLKMKDFEKFHRENSSWLDDYSTYMALRNRYGGKDWIHWDPVHREKKFTEDQLPESVIEDRDFNSYLQWKFARQWEAFRKYAAEKNVKIIGDAPIFVAYGSSDVWSNRRFFKLNPDGTQSVVAGVPPDYFSKEGQLWGNPLYDWDEHRKDGYNWWKARILNLLNTVDIVRIDHFRGFEACWEVPRKEKTAINGRWVQSGGWDLFKKLAEVMGENIPIIAEDLGIITEEVEDLRDAFDLPGMKIFEFCPWHDLEELAEAPYLPVNYIENCVAYTGTHDNEPLLGWFRKLSGAEQENIMNYLGIPELSDDLHWKVMENIMNSRAFMVIFPIQDILGLGEESRFNTPGTTGVSNWAWRTRKSMFTDKISKKFRKLVEYSER